MVRRPYLGTNDFRSKAIAEAAASDILKRTAINRVLRQGLLRNLPRAEIHRAMDKAQEPHFRTNLTAHPGQDPAAVYLWLHHALRR